MSLLKKAIRDTRYEIRNTKYESDRKMANKISTFLQAVKAEMKKVTWPSRSEIIRSTLIVMVTIVIFGIFIGGIDFMFFQILKFFLG